MARRKEGEMINFLNLIEQTRRDDVVLFDGERDIESGLILARTITQFDLAQIRRREREEREARIRELESGAFLTEVVEEIQEAQGVEVETPRNIEKKMGRFSSLKEALEILLFEEAEAQGHRKAEITPVFTRSGRWDLHGTYGNDEVMKGVIMGYGKLNAEQRIIQSRAHALEQIAYDYYVQSQQGDEQIFGKSATKELYEHLQLTPFHLPDLLLVANNQIKEVIEVTTSGDPKYYSDKVKKFRRTIEDGMLANARLKFLLPRDMEAQYSPRERDGINFSPLPVSVAAVSDIVLLLLSKTDSNPLHI